MPKKNAAYSTNDWLVQKLKTFRESYQVPHLLLHGPAGSGKSYIVNQHLRGMYGDDLGYARNNQYFMTLNCFFSKGIKHIRDRIKCFAEIQLSFRQQQLQQPRTIVLYNADQLTGDAQSALRRCIEIYSNKVRFLFIVEDLSMLMRPLLSRFSTFFVSYGAEGNLYEYHNRIRFPTWERRRVKRHQHLKEQFETIVNKRKNMDGRCDGNNGTTGKELYDDVHKLYEEGYCAIDLMKIIRESENPSTLHRYQLLEKIILPFVNHEEWSMWIILMFYCQPRDDGRGGIDQLLTSMYNTIPHTTSSLP